MKLFCETSAVFELDNIKNAAIQRDFLNFCIWQRQKRSNSARLPHFFLSWQHQKRSNSARRPSNMESWVQSWRPRAIASIFQHHLSKLLRLQRKSDTGSYEVLHLSRKIVSANLTTACNFSSLICTAGSAPAALASLLFDPPEPQIIGKTQCFGTFLPFRAPGSFFFWDFLFFDLLSSSLLFTDSSHLCFSSVHIVGSLASKLPSISNLGSCNMIVAMLVMLPTLSTYTCRTTKPKEGGGCKNPWWIGVCPQIHPTPSNGAENHISIHFPIGLRKIYPPIRPSIPSTYLVTYSKRCQKPWVSCAWTFPDIRGAQTRLL